jgi:hypothetical protein
VLTAAAVVVIGLWALKGLGRLTDRTSPPYVLATREPTATPPVGWAAPLQLAGGRWTIAEFPWQLAVHPLSHKLTEAELLTLPPRATPADPQLSSRESELLTVFKQLATKKPLGAGLSVYLMKLAERRIVLFALDTPLGERMVCVRADFSAGDGSPCLLEATPLQGPVFGVVARFTELLPLPKASRLLATRLDAAGRVAAELALADAEVDTLRHFWQEEGFHAEVFMQQENMLGVTCWRGEKGAQVWLWPRAAGTARTLLLLVRLSEVLP